MDQGQRALPGQELHVVVVDAGDSGRRPPQPDGVGRGLVVGGGDEDLVQVPEAPAVHQPLHAVEEARGGNDIKLPVFGSPKCGDYDCNLHWTWDTLLLEHTGFSEEDYVARLNELIAQKRLEKQAGGTAVDWANESHLQARRILDQKPAAVDEAYYRANIDLVNEKLALGGLRLATVLNSALGKEAAPQRGSLSPKAATERY